MHRSLAATRPTTTYRERLSPSLWVIVSAAVTGPMVALVVAPLDAVVAMIAGALFGAAVIAALFALSPVIEIDERMLRVGRARIDLAFLGDAEAFTGDAAREARGPGLSSSSWHLLRGGVDGVVRVGIRDEDDPVRHWVFSSRTPERVVAVLTAHRVAAAPARSDDGHDEGPVAPR